MPCMHQPYLGACNALANAPCGIQQRLKTEKEKKEKLEAKCKAQINDSRNLTTQLKNLKDALDRQKKEKKNTKEGSDHKRKRDFLVTERIGLKR